MRVREVVHGCVLEFDADAAARGVSDGLFGLVVETVGDQAAMGRPQGGTSQQALTRKQMLGGGGALEVGDLCLLEDGSERNGALSSDVVSIETASEGHDGKPNCERAGVSMGADTKANTPGRRRTRGW